MAREHSHRLLLASVVLLISLQVGCKRGVVVYTAQDEEFAAPIFEKFTRKSDVAVEPKYDSESTKTVGLYTELVAEADRPRADVFWNNEPLNTLRLEKLGLLDVYRSPMAEAYPAIYRSANGTWAGFAARARVLVVNKTLSPSRTGRNQSKISANPKWNGHAAWPSRSLAPPPRTPLAFSLIGGRIGRKQYYRQLRQNRIEVLAG